MLFENVAFSRHEAFSIAITEMMKVRALKCIECFVLNYEPPLEKFGTLLFKSLGTKTCKLAKGIHKLEDCRLSMEEGLRWTEENLLRQIPTNSHLLIDVLRKTYTRVSRAVQNAYYDFCEERPRNYPNFPNLNIPERLVELKSVVKKEAEEFYADLKEVSIRLIY